MIVLNNTQAEKLKPCPFCGSKNVKLYVFDCQSRSGVRCEECGISVSITNDMTLLSNKNRVKIWTKNAIKVWNTRKYTEV